MELSNELLDQIRAYIQKRMTPEENRSFEQRMEENEALKAEVALQRRLFNAALALKTRERLSALQHEVQQENELAKRSLRKTYAVAASVAIFVLSGLYVSKVFFSGSPEKVYAEFYSDDTRHRAQSFCTSAGLDEAVDLYHEKKYTPALEKLKTLDPADDCVSYYTAISYLALEEPAEAAKILAGTSASENAVLAEKSQWYLALAYLALKDKPRATEILRKIVADPDNAYNRMADKALQKLQ